MRKKVFGRKLSRNRKSRIALERSLFRALIDNGKITTTLAKAKFVESSLEKLISVGKRQTLASEREALAMLGNDRETLKKLYQRILPSVKARKSGFTRIVRLPKRLGDSAEVAIISFVDEIIVPQETKVEKEEKAKGKKEGVKKAKKEKKEVKKTKKTKKTIKKIVKKAKK